MKKYMYIIFIMILFIPFTVFADTVTCKSTTLTCTFDTSNVTGNADCTATDGKNYNNYQRNYNTHITDDHYRDLDTAINFYKAMDDVNQGKCPPYVVIDSTSAKELFFLPSGPFTFVSEYDQTQTVQTYTVQQIRDWIVNIKGYGSVKGPKVLLESFTLQDSTVSTDCNSKIILNWNSLNSADSAFVNSGCSDKGQSISTTDCGTQRDKLQTELTNANTFFNANKENGSCSYDELTRLSSLITTAQAHLTSYDNNYVPQTSTTGVTTTTVRVDTGKQNGCPLGEEVTKDLAGALRVMRIMAPVFIITYTIYDVIVAISKGDVQAEGKNMLRKFLKRMIAAIILFFIPLLIDVLMQMFNVWDNTGHCSFTNISSSSGSSGGGGGGSNTTTTNSVSGCLSACEHAGDQTQIDNCKRYCTTTTTTSCEQKCQAIPDEQGRNNCLSGCH